MADPEYDIYFRGEILPGADEARVKATIAKMFKADAAKLAILFSGKVNPIKKSVNKATATKYQQAFKQAGAKAVITLAKKAAEQTAKPEAQAKAQNQVQPQTKTVAAKKIAESNWDVLPSGSDLLKPDERQQVADVHIDTSAIKVVSPFAEIEQVEKFVPPAPDTTHISVADVGEDMNPDRIAPAADLELDLSNFSIAEAGADLVEKKEKPAPPAPDTNHIKLV